MENDSFAFDTESIPKLPKKYKTVELIEEEIKHTHKAQRIPVNKKLFIRIRPKEMYLRKVVKDAGGKWNAEMGAWILPYQDIKNLGLEERIVHGKS